jgi:glycosyltransferase involved in cell wall biosynthesis
MSEAPAHATPAVSVVMPVYNCGRYLAEAIHSILDQSFTDFELIVVNDGSTDDTEDVIRSIVDDRIRYMAGPNQGISTALNTGLAMARAPLIARMDGDDVSLPSRLQEQVTFLRSHPEVGMVGTWATVTDMHGEPVSALRHPCTHARISYSLLYDSPFVHPSVMFRRSVIDAVGTYDTSARTYEDLDLWSRMMGVTRFANIPVELIRYREVPTSISRTTKREHRVLEHRRRTMAEQLPGLDPENVELLARTGHQHLRITRQRYQALCDSLFTFIHGLTKDQEDLGAILKDARARLMSFHLIPHRNILLRASDRILKTMILYTAQKKTA